MLRLEMIKRMAVLPGALVLLVYGGCTGTPEPPKPKPPNVTVAEPEIRDVHSYLDFTGKIQALETVEIRARVQGFLEKIHYKESLVEDPNALTVKKGGTLFTIERPPYEVKLEEAQASEASAAAQLIEAQANYDRGVELKQRDPNAITPVQESMLLADRDKAAAAVAAGKAGVSDAQINLAYTEITAPISGRISRSLVDEGNLVGSGEQTLLATIVTIHPIHAYFDVPERVLQTAKRRMEEQKAAETGGSKAINLPTVLLGQDADNGAYPHEGKLDYVDNQVDPNTATGTVRAVFPNPKGLLVSGSSARVRVLGEVQKDAVLVYEQALQTDLDGKFLLVVHPGADEKTGEKNLVEKRRVELGQLTSDRMRVITSGLEPDEQYIVEGLQRARSGMPVEPAPFEAETSATEDAKKATEEEGEKSENGAAPTTDK